MGYYSAVWRPLTALSASLSGTRSLLKFFDAFLGAMLFVTFKTTRTPAFVALTELAVGVGHIAWISVTATVVIGGTFTFVPFLTIARAG